MTRIIIESNKNSDVLLIKELAERLKIKYKIQELPSQKTAPTRDIEHCYELINKGADVSVYGDPSQWQKKVREDRNINLS